MKHRLFFQAHKLTRSDSNLGYTIVLHEVDYIYDVFHGNLLTKVKFSFNTKSKKLSLLINPYPHDILVVCGSSVLDIHNKINDVFN